LPANKVRDSRRLERVPASVLSVLSFVVLLKSLSLRRRIEPRLFRKVQVKTRERCLLPIRGFSVDFHTAHSKAICSVPPRFFHLFYELERKRHLPDFRPSRQKHFRPARGPRAIGQILSVLNDDEPPCLKSRVERFKGSHG
jgi:hypothetical protein